MFEGITKVGLYAYFSNWSFSFPSLYKHSSSSNIIVKKRTIPILWDYSSIKRELISYLINVAKLSTVVRFGGNVDEATLIRIRR